VLNKRKLIQESEEVTLKISQDLKIAQASASKK
jgi:hypothetical protein